MKKFKLLSFVLLSTLVMGLTSCLSDSNSNTGSNAVIAKVCNVMGTTYFETSDSIKIIPTSTSMATVESTYNFTATSGLAYIYYTYDSSTSSSSTSDKSYTVDLQYAVSLQNAAISTTKGASNDSIATRPVYSLDALSTSSSDNFTMFDSHLLLLAANYYMSTANHYFALIYYPDDTNSGDTEMNIYLRQRSTDTSTEYLSGNYSANYPSLYFKSFDIAEFLSDFEEKAGALPKGIILHVNISTSTNDINTSTERTYTINYTSKSIE